MKFMILTLFMVTTSVFAAPSIDGISSIVPVSAASTLSTVNAPIKDHILSEDASSVLIKGPVASANKLLYDIDAQIKALIDEKTSKSNDAKVEIHAPTYSRELNLDVLPRQSPQPNALVVQLENLEKRLQTTMNELQTRRRMVSYTILKQMYNSVSRVRLDIVKLQSRFSANQQVAHPVPTPANQSGIMKALQQQISNLQNSVNEVINRVTSSFQRPTKTPVPHQLQN